MVVHSHPFLYPTPLVRVLLLASTRSYSTLFLPSLFLLCLLACLACVSCCIPVSGLPLRFDNTLCTEPGDGVDFVSTYRLNRSYELLSVSAKLENVEGRGVGPTLKSCTRRDEGGSIEHRKGLEGF
jgi:hypothetical protein